MENCAKTIYVNMNKTWTQTNNLASINKHYFIANNYYYKQHDDNFTVSYIRLHGATYVNNVPIKAFTSYDLSTYIQGYIYCHYILIKAVELDYTRRPII